MGFGEAKVHDSSPKNASGPSRAPVARPCSPMSGTTQLPQPSSATWVTLAPSDISVQVLRQDRNGVGPWIPAPGTYSMYHTPVCPPGTALRCLWIMSGLPQDLRPMSAGAPTSVPMVLSLPSLCSASRAGKT